MHISIMVQVQDNFMTINAYYGNIYFYDKTHRNPSRRDVIIAATRACKRIAQLKGLPIFIPDCEARGDKFNYSIPVRGYISLGNCSNVALGLLMKATKSNSN